MIFVRADSAISSAAINAIDNYKIKIPGHPGIFWLLKHALFKWCILLVYMLCNIRKYTVIGLLICGMFAAPLYLFAQDTQSNPSAHKQLELQLKDLEQQILQYEKQLTTLKGQKNSLANKIAQLKIEQQKIAALIEETSLKIQSTSQQIFDTQQAIAEAMVNERKTKQYIATVLLEIHLRDRYSLVEILFLKTSLSAVIQEQLDLQAINQSLSNALILLRQTQVTLRDTEARLEEQRSNEQNLVALKALQGEGLVASINEQNDILRRTRGRESAYQTELSETKKRAAEIRNRIYELFGVSKQVPFGQAVTIAEWASGQTGVRTAFLLAVLTQESNLGKNVGTCNRAGDPPEKSWKAIMKPERDQEPFIKITKELGLDPDITPVSCPMRDKKGNRVGWGGAMGPAQFIPSTWLGYKSKIAAVTGKIPNPWDIRDAFIAAAIKLKADGAGTVGGEWTAAMKYFSGSTNPAFSFYGDNVVALAKKYQADIDSLD